MISGIPARKTVHGPMAWRIPRSGRTSSGSRSVVHVTPASSCFPLRAWISADNVMAAKSGGAASRRRFRDGESDDPITRSAEASSAAVTPELPELLRTEKLFNNPTGSSLLCRESRRNMTFDLWCILQRACHQLMTIFANAAVCVARSRTVHTCMQSMCRVRSSTVHTRETYTHVGL